jgi:hypothetical protein
MKYPVAKPMQVFPTTGCRTLYETGWMKEPITAIKQPMKIVSQQSFSMVQDIIFDEVTYVALLWELDIMAMMNLPSGPPIPSISGF